jgi:glycosyltransferase involved in cell wall biosynthesis
MRNVKPKIVHIIPTLGRGGAERQLVNLLKGLNASYEMTLITLKDAGAMSGEVVDCGVKLVEINYDFSERLANLKVLPQVYKLILEIQPDLIHAWMFDANFISAILSPFWSSHKLIVGKRSADQGSNKKRLLAERWAYGRADIITTNAQALRDELPSRFLRNNKTQVIPNGTSLVLPEGNSDDPVLNTPEGFVLIGQIARFGRMKGYRLLVDVAKLFKSRGIGAHFVFVGARGNIDEIRQKVRDLDLEDYITFTGEVSNVYGYLRQLDIIALASDYEGMPNAIMEAMVVGKCTVATRVGGVPELIRDGETGFIVEPADVEAMTSRLIQLVESPELREAFGLRAKEHIKDFSIENMVTKYQTLYQELLD